MRGTVSILIAALGGEGGGTLMNWIVDAAIAAGLPVQSTSVPGVAQRTGSTSYYIEIGAAGTKPVFALVPMAGRVDVVIASELAEAARMLERGFVSPERTTFITATSRVFTTAEKMHMGDGRFSDARILEAGAALARRFVPLDLSEMARLAGTVISAPMFGALAGADVLPFSRMQAEAMLKNGRGAEASLRGFAAAFAAARSEDHSESISQDIPPSLYDLGVSRCEDYLDAAYAGLFAARVKRLETVAGDLADPLRVHALEEATRRLALWMTYEDIPRVASLKIRPERFTRIAREAEMRAGQVLKVTDLFKPGLEEIAAMLPVSLGARLMARHAAGKEFPFIGKGLHLRSTGITGHFMLRILAFMGRFRRASLRFRDEQEAIETWLAAMVATLPAAPAFAGALAELPRLLKGYGETQARGHAHYTAIFAAIVTPALSRGVSDGDAAALRRAMSAALADPEGGVLGAALSLPPVVMKAAE